MHIILTLWFPCLQLLGLNVSKAEMKELLSEVDRDGSGAPPSPDVIAHHVSLGCLMTAPVQQASVTRCHVRPHPGMSIKYAEVVSIHMCCSMYDCERSSLWSCAGELEFAEFLEVMTSTLKRIEERKQDGEERQASPVSAGRCTCLQVCNVAACMFRARMTDMQLLQLLTWTYAARCELGC